MKKKKQNELIDKYKDPAQETKINNLIKRATSIANQSAHTIEPGQWDKDFHRAMNKMAHELGLRVL